MTSDTGKSFKCPNCGNEIEISEMLAGQIRKDVETEFERDKKIALDLALKNAETRFNQQLKETEALRSVERADMEAQLIEREKAVEKAQQQELEIRRKARLLEQKQKDMEIEIARRLDNEKSELAHQLREQMDQEYHLKISEKEKQIEDLRKSVAEVKRKSEVGSQESQGEIFEMDLEKRLAQAFPQDSFSSVSKGVRGADIIQEVRNESFEGCGSIIWEAKNAKRWTNGWIEKLKDDQRNVSATFAIIVSSVLPDGVKNFGQVDGVWVSDMQSCIGLTTALRYHLQDLAFARQAGKGISDKVEMVYQYLAGEEFKQRIEAIVESFNSMQEQLMRERRAMEKLWKEREKQIQRITNNTVGMYGEMRGIIGSGLPTIKSLELDEDDTDSF